MMNALRESWQRRFFAWLDRRMAPAAGYELRRDKLYIFPTRTGLVFSVLVAILWMLGTNYQNNLILGLCLLLASLFILVILRTHNNLAGLQIQFKSADSGFAGENIPFSFSVTNGTRQHKDGVHLQWYGEPSAALALESLESGTVAVPAFAPQRGYLEPGRLRVETVYPLGLLRCWSWLNIDARAVVYPNPENHRELAAHFVEGEQDQVTMPGGEDFAGLRSYYPGDPLKHVAWKHYARGQGFMSKQFDSGVSHQTWLSWQALDGLETERRLSTLCYWALHYDRLGQAYGLDLPGTHIAPAVGPQHRHQVLSALALFGKKGGSRG
jgi:uncharacterized protein (DUF58 family)